MKAPGTLAVAFSCVPPRAVPNVMSAGLFQVMMGVAFPTVKVNVMEPVPPALVALMVTDEAPAAMGMPEMIPVTVSIDNPAGNPVALKLVGVSVAVML